MSYFFILPFVRCTGFPPYFFHNTIKGNRKGNKSNKAIGKGEAAGIALAATYNGVLASNNYRDIAPYIEKYGLRHVDTGMILSEALGKKLLTEEEGNSIWKKMLNRNRKLPANSFSDYLKSKENV